MTVDCRTCQHWFDYPLEATPAGQSLLYGCNVYGEIENFRQMVDCASFTPQAEPFVLCRKCHLPVPRVCYLLGECVNCVDTDIFCLEQCTGGEWQKYCSHWNRLNLEGGRFVKGDKLHRVFPADFERDRNRKRPGLRAIFEDFIKRPAVKKSAKSNSKR